MKVAITLTGGGLDTAIDPRFGRCAYIAFVDTDAPDVAQIISNPSRNAGGGAGVQTAQTVINGGAKAVLTGAVGPNSLATLNAGAVKIYTGISGTGKDAIEKFKRGELQETTSPTNPPLHETGGGMGGGQGRW